MKKSPNVWIVVCIFWGFILLNIAKIVHSPLPPLVVCTGYYLLMAFVFHKIQFASFLVVSFVFISFYFCFIIFKQISLPFLWETWQSEVWAIRLYISLLLPLTFLSFTANFFALPYELVSVRGKLFLFVIPILLKRELILKRFDKILEALYTKGLETRTIIQKYRLMPLWIVPLVTTTIMEGLESYQYNEMLKTKIESFSPKQNPYKISVWQKIAFFTSFTVLLFTFFAKWKYL